MDDELDNITIGQPISPVGPAQNAQVRPGLTVSPPISVAPIVIDYLDVRVTLDQMRQLKHSAGHHFKSDATYPLLRDRLHDWRAIFRYVASKGDDSVELACYFAEQIDKFL